MTITITGIHGSSYISFLEYISRAKKVILAKAFIQYNELMELDVVSSEDDDSSGSGKYVFAINLYFDIN